MTARNLLDEVSLFVNMYYCLPIFPTFLKAVKLVVERNCFNYSKQLHGNVSNTVG